MKITTGPGRRLPTMKLVIVRHGGTEWTLSGRYTGTTDLSLTPSGRRQAALLAPVVERVLAGHSAGVFQPPPTRHRNRCPRPPRPADNSGSACRGIPIRRLRRPDRRPDPPA